MQTFKSSYYLPRDLCHGCVQDQGGFVFLQPKERGCEDVAVLLNLLLILALPEQIKGPYQVLI